MSYTCAKFQGNKKNDLSTLVFLNQNSPNFIIISLIFNLKSEFFRIFQKKGPNFRKLRNLTYLGLLVIQFWAKKKKPFWIHSSSSFIHSFIIITMKRGKRFATSSLLANAAEQVAPRRISPIPRISRKSRTKLEIVAPRKPIAVLFRGNLQIEKYFVGINYRSATFRQFWRTFLVSLTFTTMASR